MARKSNKTSHVLNLLSGSDNSAAEETQPSAPKEKSVPAQTPASESKVPAAANAPADKPVISIIDHTDAEQDPIAEQIMHQLMEDEAEQPENDNSQADTLSDALSQVTEVEETPTEQFTAELDAKIKEEPEVLPVQSPSVSAAEESVPMPAAAPAKPTAASEKVASASAEVPLSPAGSSPVTADVSPLQEEVPHTAERSYDYANVMERIVQDKVIYFIREFKMCECDRCVTDITALALTNLPAKYIVVDKSALSPLMNYYSNKYIGMVTVELTKACMTVKEFPHH